MSLTKAFWLCLCAMLLVRPALAAPVPDAFLPSPPPVELLPVPKEVTWGKGTFALTPQTRIVVGDAAADEDLFAARELNEEMQARFALTLPVVRAADVKDPRGHILLGEPSLNALGKRVLDGARLSVSAMSPGPEGYVLRATPDHIVVAGSDRRGTFYGVQTLRQIIRPGGTLATVREVTIRDRPDHAVRAVHVLLDGASGEFHSALIDRILGPYKFNTLIAEAEYVQWESGRPWWAPDPRGATKAQVRRLLDVARQHHIQVIPLLATLGHSEWVFAGVRNEELCRQLAYIPQRLREEGKTQVTCDRSRGVFPAVYDPVRPVVLDGVTTTVTEALIFPVLREAIDLFAAPVVHIGHDEVRGPSGVRYDLDLYLRDVITLDGFLRGSGVKTMMWGDVLWERRDEVATEPAFADLPRDIAIAAWKYEDVREYPELAHFRRSGFPVLGTTWFRLHNNFRFSRAAKAAGAAGMIRATWTGHFQNRAAPTRAYRQLYTYLTASAYFWNSARPRPEAMPSEPALAQRFADAWAPQSYRRQPVSGTLIDLRPVVTQRHIDDSGEGWLGKGAEYDLRALRPGRQRFGGVLFEILDPHAGGRSIVMLRGERETASAMPAGVVVPWRGRAGCLVFLHAALDRASSFGDVIGRYTVTVNGGRRIPIELAYGRNISSWLADVERGIPSIEQEVAWSGKTKAGNEVGLQMLRWKNPDPALPVESIELSSAGGRASPVVFAITALDRCP